MSDVDGAGGEFAPYLGPTETIESTHPAVTVFARELLEGANGQVDAAVRLYYGVRDGVRYDPYTCVMTVDALKASAILEAGRGWCVPKAILLAACCRSIGIPARLGYADVRNHLSTARMREVMGTDLFYWHGYTDIYLEGAWIKATPAFNLELCEKFRLKPLEWDGTEDSLYHPFDLEGNKHMEYVNYRGEYADAPIQEIADCFEAEYPGVDLAKGGFAGKADADFDKDVAAETAR